MHKQLLTGSGSAAGACKADIKALCKDVSPGDDRLLWCLVKRMKQAQQGNIAGVLSRLQLCNTQLV